MMKNLFPALGLMLVAQESMAGLPLGLPLGLNLPSALPFGISGVAGLAIVSLIIGTQVIKRKK